VAGNGTGGFSGDGGQAISAEIHDPEGIAVDPTGNLFIVDSQNYRVRRVDHATGVITTAAGTGAGPNSYTGDGSAATSAGVGQMRGICCDANGNFYVGCAYAFNNYSVVRVVNTQATTQTILTVSVPAGCIATVVGSVGNGNGYGGDGGAATNAAVKMSVIVWTLAIDPAGNLILDDLTNYRVREVSTSTGIITTICGTGTSGNTGNGGAATSANIGRLFGLAPVFPFVPPSTPCVIGESQLDSFPPPTSTAGDKFVRFRLRGFEGSVPQSTGQLVTITATLTLAGDSISQPLLANSGISPAGTFYTVEFWSNQRITSSANYNFTTSVDLSSAVPI
jgi:hypothetical protein